jgi:hypothetical protein
MLDYETHGADSMHKWVNNVKVILKKQGVRAHLRQDRDQWWALVHAVKKNSRSTVGFSQRALLHGAG